MNGMNPNMNPNMNGVNPNMNGMYPNSLLNKNLNYDHGMSGVNFPNIHPS